MRRILRNIHEDYSPSRRSRNLYEGKLTNSGFGDDYTMIWRPFSKNMLKNIDYYLDMDNYDLGREQSDKEFQKEYFAMIRDLTYMILNTHIWDYRSGDGGEDIDGDINSIKEIFNFVVHIAGPEAKKYEKAVKVGYNRWYPSN